jgi:hypothetical protein
MESLTDYSFSIPLDRPLVPSRLYRTSAAPILLAVKNMIPRRTMSFWKQIMVAPRKSWADRAFLYNLVETLL